MARGAPRSYNLDLFTDEAAVAAGARLEPWPNTRRFPLNVDHHQVQEQVLWDLRGSECKTGTDRVIRCEIVVCPGFCISWLRNLPRLRVGAGAIMSRVMTWKISLPSWMDGLRSSVK